MHIFHFTLQLAGVGPDIGLFLWPRDGDGAVSDFTVRCEDHSWRGVHLSCWRLDLWVYWL